MTTIVNGENFYSRGRTEVERGWKAVQAVLADKEDKDEERLPEQALSAHRRGEAVTVQSCKINKQRTKPPGRYTEATLLTAMEHCGKWVEDEELRESIKGSGLGTPATRAEIIEKLIHTSYIERHGKELLPTSKGIQLIGLAPPALRSPELTAQWEQRLADIAKGRAKRSGFIADIRRDTSELVEAVKNSQTVYKADNISKSKCPQCGKFMLIVNGKRGRMLSCPDRDCGHRQPEKENPYGYKGESRANQKLIARYSDQEELGTNLGDLFKAALAKKQEEK
jgi:DNA topoisomerase-3